MIMIQWTLINFSPYFLFIVVTGEELPVAVLLIPFHYFPLLPSIKKSIYCKSSMASA